MEMNQTEISQMEEKQIIEYRELLLGSDSADMYDVLDRMGYPNQCMDIGIGPLRDDMKVAGPAFTYWGMREPRYDEQLPPRPDFDNNAIFTKITKHCVIVINAEKDDVAGHWGEMMSYGARAAGAVGAVVDGGTRDKRGILKIDNWACFARYTSPVESKKRWRPIQSQVPIYVTGTLTKQILVRPGDWIFGDCDGVIVIPAEILPEAVEKVTEISRSETLSRADFNAGATFAEVYAKYRRA